jgi:hypothetical protein
MRSAGICFAFLAMVAPCACWGHAAGQNPSPIDAADRLFQAGQFAQAREQYTRIAAEHPDDYSAILQLGRIALLSNPSTTPRLGWNGRSRSAPATATPRSCSPRPIIAATISKRLWRR